MILAGSFSLVAFWNGEHALNWGGSRWRLRCFSGETPSMLGSGICCCERWNIQIAKLVSKHSVINGLRKSKMAAYEGNQLAKTTWAVWTLLILWVCVKGWHCKTNGMVQNFWNSVVPCCPHKLEILIFALSHVEKNVLTPACNCGCIYS